MGKWIIVPEKILEVIKNKASGASGYYHSAKTIEDCLRNFIDDDLLTIAPLFYNAYNNSLKKNSLSTLKRALNERGSEEKNSLTHDGNGISWKSETKTPILLDFLCYYGFGIPYKEVLLKLNIKEADIKYRHTGKEDATKQTESEPLSVIQDNYITYVTNTIQTTGLSKSLFQIIDDSFWSKYILPENEIHRLGRYYTHADSSIIYYVIANGEIIPPEDFITISDSDGNTEQRTLTEALKNHEGIGNYLIKVTLGEGVGKTSFLFWIAYHFKSEYNFISISHIGVLDLQKIITAAKNLKQDNGLPVVFLLDNVSDPDISNQLERFINEIKTITDLSDSIFIICERTSRFESEFGNNRIANIFGGNLITIENINVDRSKLFEKAYNALTRNNLSLADDVIKEQSRNEYLKIKLDSISEQIFSLIRFLKLKNEINYAFAWEDWQSFINSSPSYSQLRHLYAVVACFYQFGIRVSVNIQSEILQYTRPPEIISAIHAFGNNDCPIQLSEDGGFLKLHHEKLAEWYFRMPENRQIAKAFFTRFLNEITSETNAKLIRKIRKISKLEEFQSSFLVEFFNPNKYIEIIDTYLELPDVSDTEKKKMLVERGLTYISLNKKDEAIRSFESVLLIEENNNHAKDQLARIYLESPKNYAKAFNYYYQIYKNDGTYALGHLYAIIGKCKNEGIEPDSIGVFHFSENDRLEISSMFIQRRILEPAITILDSLSEDTASYEIAKQYNTIAHYTPFADETIEEKRTLYKKAIDCIGRSAYESHSIDFHVDYAVFLYRIRKFSESTAHRNAIIKDLKPDDRIKFEELFLSKIRRVTKLFFVNVPDRDNKMALQDFLYEQCRHAAALINKDMANIETIIKGILILHTVRFHAGGVLPNVSSDATLQLGYAYTYHAEKPINELSPADRKILAESYYDSALRSGAEFSLGDCYDMLRNLQNFQYSDKYEKSIRVIQLFFKNPWNRKVPGLYRMRGNAHSFLGHYEQAIKDYEKSLVLLPLFRYKSKEDFKGDKAYVYNGIASMACDMFEKNISINGYDLARALSFASQAVVLKPKSPYLKKTLERVKNLLG